MKILIAAGIFPPQAGGPATYVVALANALPKEDVIVVSHNKESDKNAVHCKMYSVLFKNKVLRYVNYFFLLYKHSKYVDVIYAMGPVTSGWPASVVAKWRKKKLVIKVVGDYAWEQGRGRHGLKLGVDEFQTHKFIDGKIKSLRLRQSKVVKQADLVITPSIYLKKMVEGWGAKNVQVVYNAIKQDSEIFTKDKPGNEKWIVSVGRLVSWKGFSTLIKVMPEVLKANPEVKLKIIGSGPEEFALKKQIKDANLLEKVEMLGKLPVEEVGAYMSAADLFVLNTGYEGLSHAILETLHAGTIVAVSKVGGNPELVEDGKNGYLFAYNNEEDIVRVIGKAFASKLIWSEDEQKIFFQKFNFIKMIESTLEKLKSV